MGVITLGLFAVTGRGGAGAVLQMVNHGLVSAALFLLAGAIERRTGTGLFSQLGGLARGRPALATLVMTAGGLSLPLPPSAHLASEVLLPARGFNHRLGWGRL